MKLKGKIVLVTGAGGLLGKAFVKRIKEEGGVCISGDINLETDLDNGRLDCDITDQASVHQAVTAIISKFGRIDGLVNTAYPRTKDWGNKFEDIALESWKKNIDLQLNSVFILCKAVLEHMNERKSGTIINLSSIYGVVGPDFSVYDGTKLTMPAAYSAIKGGIVNLTRYLASYYGPSGIRINCVSPGGIFDNQDPVFVNNYERKVPLRRMGTPEDIAGTVGFLLSDDAAYITGQNIIVDGGWTSI